MAPLDVNALVALARDAHVHHEAIGAWFDARTAPWATCPVTEAGSVRISSNPKALAGARGVAEARGVLRDLRAVGEHRFLADDVSPTDPDVPPIGGHRQVTDAPAAHRRAPCRRRARDLRRRARQARRRRRGRAAATLTSDRASRSRRPAARTGPPASIS